MAKVAVQDNERLQPQFISLIHEKIQDSCFPYKSESRGFEYCKTLNRG
ncbi:MAG: hypothetical protein LAP21_04630 [Acidobacteriia bacterium]|nr:hypothetical protein [Terriglobia bacterium]